MGIQGPLSASACTFDHGRNEDLIVGLCEQNQQLVEGQKALQRRVETMENEAIQSASSGADGRDVGTLGVLRG